MNIIVTCARHLEPETEEEIKQILDKFGDSNAKVSITKMSGILTVQTTLDPVSITRQMRDMILDEPWNIRYCMRVIPIQNQVNTEIEEIGEIIDKIKKEILEGETYRISIEKRNSDLSSKEIISKIANKIENKVSLNYPDKIVLIEILGAKTGVSILKKSDILSLEKTKRSISE